MHLPNALACAPLCVAMKSTLPRIARGHGVPSRRMSASACEEPVSARAHGRGPFLSRDPGGLGLYAPFLGGLGFLPSKSIRGFFLNATVS